jgi:hypothetical protein
LPATAQVFSWRADEKRFRLSAPRQENLVLRLFNYPAWEATINDRAAQTETTDVTGLLVIAVPAGVSDVRLRFRRTPDRTLGAAMSLLTIVLFLVLSCRVKEQRLEKPGR